MKFIWILPVLALVLFLGCSASTYRYRLTASTQSDECVILVHGLRGSSSSFESLQQRLTKEGYAVLLIDYPSTKFTIPTLANSLFSEVLARSGPEQFDSLHVIAHSMGAIMVRYYLQEHALDRLGRVVFLSPPNHGIELINRFDWCAWFRKFNGPGGMQLAAGDTNFVESLQPPDYPVGILMSSRSINPVASMFIPGKDDGRVSIKSAKLEGMRDFKLISTNHHVIMRKQATISAAIHFLKNGYFENPRP